MKNKYIANINGNILELRNFVETEREEFGEHSFYAYNCKIFTADVYLNGVKIAEAKNDGLDITSDVKMCSGLPAEIKASVNKFVAELVNVIIDRRMTDNGEYLETKIDTFGYAISLLANTGDIIPA